MRSIDWTAHALLCKAEALVISSVSWQMISGMMLCISTSALYFFPLMTDYFLTFYMSSDTLSLYEWWEGNDGLGQKVVRQQWEGNDGLGQKVVRQQIQFWAGIKVEKMRVRETVCNEKETGEWPNLCTKNEETVLLRRNSVKAVNSAFFIQFYMMLEWIRCNQKSLTQIQICLQNFFKQLSSF